MRPVKKDFQAAGIAELDERGRKADFHALRMTFCTLLADAEIPERVRQELMRHRDPRMTNQTYTDPARLRLAEAMAKLPRLGDTQLGTQELVAGRLEVSSDVASGQSRNEPKSLKNKGNRHVATRGVTTCPDGRNNGGGGNRTPVTFP